MTDFSELRENMVVNQVAARGYFFEDECAAKEGESSLDKKGLFVNYKQAFYQIN